MFQHSASIFVLAFGLMPHATGQSRKSSESSGALGARALSFFQPRQGENVDQFLKRIRVPQLSPPRKARMIALLPKEGEVQPSARGQAKLAALGPVLEYHERGAALDLRVIRAGQLFVGLYARAAVLITEEALDLLTTEELQAVVAHELAHEYFSDEYELAREREQCDLAQELELRCDGVAIITMIRLGLDPRRLISAVRKFTRFGEVAGAEALARFYPSRDERTRFMRAMIELVKAREFGPALAWK